MLDEGKYKDLIFKKLSEYFDNETASKYTKMISFSSLESFWDFLNDVKPSKEALEKIFNAFSDIQGQIDVSRFENKLFDLLNYFIEDSLFCETLMKYCDNEALEKTIDEVFKQEEQKFRVFYFKSEKYVYEIY